MLARYYSTDTGMVVIDDVFTPDALAELRAVVDESVVWHDDGYGEAGRGYLGAYVNDGFGTGLLFQVCGTHSRVAAGVIIDCVHIASCVAAWE